MIFMVLVGGIGTFEGAILGAVIFFADRDVVRRDGRLVPGRAGRRGAVVRAGCCPRASGAPSRAAPACGCCRSATGSTSALADQGKETNRMLFGKTIVVTGVASGIGARTAELCAHLGADIIGIDVREPPARPLCRLHQGRPLVGQAGVDAIVEAAAAAGSMRCCNVAGLSGAPAQRPNSGGQFLRAAGAERGGGAAHPAGRRHRQCRLDRRLWLARQSQSRQADGGSRGFPRRRGAC